MPCFDIIAPLRYLDAGGIFSYCPVLISVKNRLEYTASQRTAAPHAMVKALENAEVTTAVVMLFLVGLSL